MLGHKVFLLGCRKGILILLIQGLQLFNIGCCIFLEGSFFIWILFCQAITNGLNQFDGALRREPDMGVKGMAVPFLLMVMSFFLLTSRQQQHPFSRLNHTNLICIHRFQQFGCPGFHIFIFINKDICFLNTGHIFSGRFKIMDFCPSRNHQLHIGLITSHLLGKFVDRIKGGYNINLIILVTCSLTCTSCQSQN